MSSLEVGVIGGVGPAATVDFMSRVIAATDAQRDQDHVNLVVLQHSEIPDRTAFLTGAGAVDPTAALVADAQRLEALGVGGIVVPCNTAHAFIDAMRAAVTVEVVDIVAAAVEQAASRAWTTLGVLATDGTIAARTYHHAAHAHGMSVAVPDAESQRALMSLIYDEVKAGLPATRETYDDAVNSLRSQGVDGIVIGCTEISVAAKPWLHPDVIDALDVLARAAVTMGGKSLKPDESNAAG